MSKGCLKCGTENAVDARFCRSCGAKLEVPTTAELPPVQACRACGHVNRAGTRFCAKCGADQAPPVFVASPTAAARTPLPPLPPSAATRPAATTGKPMALWMGLGALIVALAAGGAWWASQSRSPALPTFDSAPPPSVTAASSPVTTTSAPAEEPAPAAAPAAPPAPAPAASSAASDLWEPAAKETIITEPSEKQLQAAKDKAARDAKAKALREQRAQAALQAQADLAARRRAEETRGRGASPPTAPAPAPAPRSAVPAPPPVQARGVQERCTSANPLARGICESRECTRPEHAGELVCQRIKAADDRRREQ